MLQYFVPLRILLAQGDVRADVAFVHVMFPPFTSTYTGKREFSVVCGFRACFLNRAESAEASQGK